VYADRALPLREMPSRLEFRGELSVISQEPDGNGTIPFRLFSKKLERAIETAMKNKRHIFLFAARRGLAPLIACIDCGHIFRDPESGSPLSLIRTTKAGAEVRTLVSGVSGFRMPAPDTCPACGGWRLRERGIGIQHVYDDLIRKYEARFITLMDRESASSHKKAVILRDAFYGNPGGIMLGTALSLPYLSGMVDLSAVVSMDSLRALPSWRQEEETMSILCHLREKTRGTVYVQTRAAEDDELFGFARQGAIQGFFERELSLREAFKYPPYHIFIHLAWRETGREEMSAARKMVTELFAPYGISIYSAPHRTPDGGIGYGLLRIERNAWPHEEVVARLRSLPPSVRIMLNPDRII
jgi:primosomal protein N' (replication factor Y) (superfamily II helicase)